jgi:hypothetical protein
MREARPALGALIPLDLPLVLLREVLDGAEFAHGVTRKCEDVLEDGHRYW